MSWDISVMHLPDVASIEEIPDDYDPPPLGVRSEVIARIQAVIPAVNFTDPSWGILDTEDFSIEFNMGTNEECTSSMLHVRGGGAVVDVIEKVINALGAKAVDCQSGEFFSRVAAEQSFEEWRKYRDRVVDGS